MKKVILIIMLAVVANIGKGQPTLDLSGTGIDEEESAYSGLSKSIHEQKILEVMEYIIIPHYYALYTDKNVLLDSICTKGLVSSFISKTAIDLCIYLQNHAHFERFERMPLYTLSNSFYYFERTPLYTLPNSFYYIVNCMCGGIGSAKFYAKEYLKVLFQFKFPGKFDDISVIKIDWQEYLKSEKLENKLKDAAACSSLEAVCHQNGAYDEKLACAVATYYCLKELENMYKSKDEEDYGRKVAFVNDYVRAIDALNTKNSGIYGVIKEKTRKAILRSFNEEYVYSAKSVK